jgi:hypothetical protein
MLDADAFGLPLNDSLQLLTMISHYKVALSD